MKRTIGYIGKQLATRFPKENPFADRMNSIPKFVPSTTLKEAEWNSKLIKGNIAEEVLKLKEMSGKDVLVYGSSDLVTR